MDQPKGVKKGSKLPELTNRTILMLKQAHPDWGCERISDMLVRGPALLASPTHCRPRLDFPWFPSPVSFRRDCSQLNSLAVGRAHFLKPVL
jgi:hypothetical protein